MLIDLSCTVHVCAWVEVFPACTLYNLKLQLCFFPHFVDMMLEDGEPFSIPPCSCLGQRGRRTTLARLCVAIALGSHSSCTAPAAEQLLNRKECRLESMCAIKQREWIYLLLFSPSAFVWVLAG